MTIYLLNAVPGATTALNTPFVEDSIVVFKSTVYTNSPSADNTSINLRNNSGSILLHISLRVAQNAIVFNTSTNGVWGREERLVLNTTFTGGQPTIVVYNRGDEFKIRIGNTIHNYKKRIDDVATTFSYGYQNTTLLSNPIIANVFTLNHLLETLAPTFA